MQIEKITEDWIDNHLYMGNRISKWLHSKGLERIGDLSKITLPEFLECDNLTIPRLKRFAAFMEKNNISFKTAA